MKFLKTNYATRGLFVSGLSENVRDTFAHTVSRKRKMPFDVQREPSPSGNTQCGRGSSALLFGFFVAFHESIF